MTADFFFRVFLTGVVFWGLGQYCMWKDGNKQPGITWTLVEVLLALGGALTALVGIFGIIWKS